MLFKEFLTWVVLYSPGPVPDDWGTNFFIKLENNKNLNIYLKHPKMAAKTARQQYSSSGGRPLRLGSLLGSHEKASIGRNALEGMLTKTALVLRRRFLKMVNYHHLHRDFCRH